MRRRRPSNSTTRWMLGIDLQPASWNGGGTESWKRSRQSSNGFPVSKPSATRYRLKRKLEYVRWAISLLESGRATTAPRHHTQLAMERPRPAAETATPMEALEIIRRMAVRYGDDQIASVLNRRGYSTGKGKRWNQTRVATARRNHSIAGQKRALHDPERVSLSEAARICGVSHHTIQRLVEAGLLKREQITPRAPWEVSRRDLDAEPIRSVIERLHRTGKLILQGGCAEDQLALFTENQGDDNARYLE